MFFKMDGGVSQVAIVASRLPAWVTWHSQYSQSNTPETLLTLCNRSFFCGQMHVFKPRADLGRCLLAFVPMLCALMVAISRLNDYRHDIYDVTCGSILGILVSYFSYRRYYPPLCSVTCDIPHDRKDADGFSRVAADEEQQLDDISGETYRLGEQGTSH